MRGVQNFMDLLSERGFINQRKSSYRGGGKYSLASRGGKYDSDDEELYSKDLLMDCSEDDEEEKLVII